jgi:ubiquinone/menaquinone biosynthesis C-methylase UbiE
MFTVTGGKYDNFMGRYSMALAPAFATFAGVESGMRVLDVGCGTGALTCELLRRTRDDLVSAIDPAEQFVAACRARAPGADVRLGPAERLPWPDGEFDRVLTQLVLPFLADADAALLEMRRIVRSPGIVAACMWGTDGEMELDAMFWRAASRMEPSAADRRRMPFRTAAEIEDLFHRAELSDVESAPLDVSATYSTFEEFWESILGSAGNMGAFVSKLDSAQLQRFRESCRDELADTGAPFTLSARAWAVRGTR